jgi:dTDP-4-amino-4,6-dideoxygalactose transaminase
MLRFHGSRDKQTFTEVGYNSRLDELQAAILRLLLVHLDEWSAGRRKAALAYAQAGLGNHVGLPSVLDGAKPAWHMYVVTHPAADALSAALAERGVEARGYYRTPVHRQPAMAAYGTATGGLPATEELARTNLALPMSPFLRSQQAQEVVQSVERATAAIGHPARVR